MLSRVIRPSSLRQAACSQNQLVRYTGTAAGQTDKKQIIGPFDQAPERDFVNFPREVRQTAPGHRLGFISENLFKFLYPKTGYTGGYVLGTGLVTFLISKELWVLEHEFWNGVGLFTVIYMLTKKFGPQVNEWCDKQAQAEIDNIYQEKRQAEASYRNAIAQENRAQYEAEGMDILFDAKKENVALQLEANYRERLMQAYTEVKKRLDYQVEKLNVERNIEQKHMVNWIVGRVTKAITAEQEQENVKKCIADLKALAARA